MFRDLGVNLKNIEELQFDARGSLVTPIEQAMPMVRKYLQDEFGGLMEAQSQTAKGIGSNIKDSMYQAGLAFMGFERDIASFRDGSLFVGMKDGLQGALDLLDRINFDEIGKEFEAGFATIKNILGDYKRGLEGVDLSGFANAFKLVAGAVATLGTTLDKYNVYEYVGEAIKLTINTINDFANAVTDTYVGAINYIVEAYNRLVPAMQKMGMEMDYIQKVSLDQSLSRFLNSADSSARKARDSVDEVADSVRALSEASSSSKIPGWAGQGDYIRARLAETGGRNIDDLLSIGGIPSNIGGNQSIGSITQASVSTSVNTPIISLVDINRNGFNSLGSKLDVVAGKIDGVIGAVGSISRGSGGFSSGDITNTAVNVSKANGLKNPLFDLRATRFIL
jgi:hypothetical protein